jgi:hypothetical protein
LIINQKPTAAMGTLLCEPEGKHPHDLHDTRGLPQRLHGLLTVGKSLDQ